jgi:hypothetical protein
MISMLHVSCGKSRSAEYTSSDGSIKVSEEGTAITTDEGAVRMDNDTELQTGMSGLAVDKIHIVDGNDEKISKREVSLNTTFSIVYEGIKNYTLKEGKAFPGLAMSVIDATQGTVIVNEADLLASYTEGLSEADASVLRATVTVGNPMKAGEYNCMVTITDKNNGNASIVSTWIFTVTE